MSNLDMSTGPQQEVAGTLPNNYSLGGGNMKADPKVPINTVPNPEAGRDDVNTGGRGGDELRQETQAHVSSTPYNIVKERIEERQDVLTSSIYSVLYQCRISTCPLTSLTCTQVLTSPISRSTLRSPVLTSPMSKGREFQ